MNLLLCCNNSALRQRWDSALNSHHLVTQATTRADLKILLQETRFEVLLIHQAMMDLATLAQLRRALPESRVFVLSDRPNDEEGLACLHIGIVGYANSYINPQRLVEATNAIGAGSVWVNQKLMQRLIMAGRPTPPADTSGSEATATPPLLEQLSNREYQIAGLVAEGLSNLEIAAQLGITERTVKAHLSAIYAKTATRGRLNLALLVNRA
ncbi:LuxR C-terminal-related transcriptional regulator [Desulfogranum mediterraneum]|uniref:LuxR C-terminal-related transcriptional regulator n=1 Tax=Desulfogranum mediterraneum TaxID=160661 RepID=UPI0004181C5E|nr:response regulator transcription factor [Desulfogranum mediterraneum]